MDDDFQSNSSFWVGMVVVVLTLAIGSKPVRYLIQRRHMKVKLEKKRKRVQKKQKVLEEQLKHPVNHGNFLSPNDIVHLSLDELIEKLQNGKLSCLEVLRAYQTKALATTKHLNCVTEFISEAVEWAKELDLKAAAGKEKGPLHGVPFSVKDNVSVRGYDSTAGLSKFVDLSATEDAALVAALRHLGAIPFCKTNVPQTLLSFGCSNPIWGSTKNPWDIERTPGGSSGGEACLIAARGSLFGIGSDIGGSARIPAAFCGVYSIKPTSSRLSYKGFRKSAVGSVGIPSVPGILARDNETVVKICRLLLENVHLKYLDPEVLPIPWNTETFRTTKKLRIGFYEEFDYFPSTPGVQRAVRMAKQKLEDLGHELVPFVPQRVDFVISSVISMFYADEGRYVLEALRADDIDPLLWLQIKVALKLPHFLKQLIRPFLYFLSRRLVPCFMAAAGYQYRHTYQLWKGILDQSEYKSDFLSKWRDHRLDICIGPAFACPAPLAKHTGRIIPAFSYACLYNYLDLPCGIVPVTKETVGDQTMLTNGYYDHGDLVCDLVKTTTKDATGLPLSVQVIGLPYQEETVLRAMSILASAVQYVIPSFDTIP